MDYVFDATLNFWDTYPVFKSLKPFKEFFEGNDEVESSIMMWFIAFCWHSYSPLFQMDEGLKVTQIGESLLGEGQFYKKNKKQIEFLRVPYMDYVDTTWDRQLRVWKDKLDEKTNFMNNLKYDEGTWDMLEKMQKSNVDLNKAYKEIVAEREKEKGTQKKGGGELSLSDAGRI